MLHNRINMAVSPPVQKLVSSGLNLPLTASQPFAACVQPRRGFVSQLLYVLAHKCWPMALHMLPALVAEPRWSTQLSGCGSFWRANRAPVMASSSTSLIEKTVMQCDFLCGWFQISRLEVIEVKALPPTSFHCVAPQWISLAYGPADWAVSVCIRITPCVTQWGSSFSPLALIE